MPAVTIATGDDAVTFKHITAFATIAIFTMMKVEIIPQTFRAVISNRFCK